ncbi:hypothetical protein C6341_g27507, partial [Phytophthora cactorum]
NAAKNWIRCLSKILAPSKGFKNTLDAECRKTRSWRLHKYDAANDQPIDELLSIYYDGYDDGKASADHVLATVSIWEDWDGTTNCPDLATSSSSSALQAFGSFVQTSHTR